MKFSIRNFKTIKLIKDFEILPLNLTAGINSSGKSSLTQSLLLLKQTIESESKETLRISGPYVVADSFTDLLYLKQKSNSLSYEFVFSKEDVTAFGNFSNYVDNEKVTSVTFALNFAVNGSIHVAESKLTITSETQEQTVGIRRNQSGNTTLYQVSASRGALLGLAENGTNRRISLTSCELEFSNFISSFGSCNQKNAKIKLFTLPAFKDIKEYLTLYFSKIFYIGPIRVQPKLIVHYESTPQTRFVEPDGENARYILHENKNQNINDSETLHEAVTRWICKRLELSQTIETTKDQSRNYRTKLHTNLGLDIDLCHVGFGVSQVLPIIVQGLMLPADGILIVEDPCVHMHPYVQAEMVDFFIELAKNQNRKIIIETHSDHIITRIRRRVSEGLPTDMVNLSFVTQTANGSTYEKINISPSGAILGQLPPKFLNTLDEDFYAILKSRQSNE